MAATQYPSVAALVLLAMGLSGWPLATRAHAEQVVYSSNFEAGAGPEWSNRTTSVTPVGGNHFLGRFSRDTVDLNLPTVTGISTVTLSFDLYVIQTWDGNDQYWGPDIWDLSANGASLLHTTFSNVFGELQAFPDRYGSSGSLYGATRGAVAINTLGYTPASLPYYGDAIYHLTYTFYHTGAGLDLEFSGLMNTGDVSDESWGLDNVQVSVGPQPFTLEIIGPNGVAPNASPAAYYQCLAHFQGGATTDVTWMADWSVSGPNTVSNGVLRTGNASTGDWCYLRASYGTQSAERQITFYSYGPPSPPEAIDWYFVTEGDYTSPTPWVTAKPCGQFTLGDRLVGLEWGVENLPVYTEWRFRYVRPDGSVAADYSGSFNNPEVWDSTWWTYVWWVRLDTVGTWHLLLDLGGWTCINAPFSVTAPTSSLTYTGDTTVDCYAPLHLSAVLTAADGTPLMGKTVLFVWNGGNAVGTTDAGGIARATYTGAKMPGMYTLTASFGGDGYYLPSQTTATFVVTSTSVAGHTVTGTGRISWGSTLRQQATFVLNACDTTQEANFAISDYGTPPRQTRCVSVTAVTFNGSKVTITGNCTINGAFAGPFTLTATDGATDSLTLKVGSYSISGSVIQGDIAIK